MQIDRPIRMAILDMNKNVENMGLASIQRIADQFGVIEYDVFDVRHEGKVPGLDYDIYISSGGPGHPLVMEGGWDKKYFPLLDQLWQYNNEHDDKKYMFFICHSFQLVCHHFGIGTISTRAKESFGIVPVDLTEAGKEDPLFAYINNPFYGADFRKYEVINPDEDHLADLNAVVTALENPDLDIDDNRALMAVRFSDTWFGTQFHPEAHPDGMVHYLRRPEKKAMIIEQFGQDTYEEMMHNALHPERLAHTRDMILPGFIKNAIDAVLARRKEEAMTLPS